MEDEGSFFPDYFEDFLIIDEADEEAPDENEEIVVIDSIEDRDVTAEEVNLDDFEVVDEYMAPEFESLQVTLLQDLPSLQVMVRSVGERLRSESNMARKRPQNQIPRSRQVTSRKTNNKRMKCVTCPNHLHEETCPTAPRGKRKLVVPLPNQGLLDMW